MTDTGTLEVKVVYSASGRQRRIPRSRRFRRTTPASRLAVFGFINLLVAGAAYYAVWWKAEPELRFKLLMNTPLPGMDAEKSADAPPRTPEEQAEITRAQTAQATLFVGSVVGWLTLATISLALLAASGGALVAKGNNALRVFAVFLAMAAFAWALWYMYERWVQYERFVPSHLRLCVGSLLLIIALVTLLINRGARKLSFTAGGVLLLSAVATVAALHIGRQFNAIKAEELFIPFWALAALLFAVQALWGLAMFPLATRAAR